MQLSSSSRKALCVQVGENAGTEIALLLEMLLEKIDRLEKNKVNVTPIVPGPGINLLQTAASSPDEPWQM